MTDTDRLQRYRRMRDFASTPEPSGAPIPERPPDEGTNRFVVQQHDATRLHWDLRLEHEGVLLSWALPRGIPWTPDENRLAVHTEDHPIEYLDFHGSIPEGEYGAGTMTIWDRGTYELEKLADDSVTVVLHGGRVQGRYALFAIEGRDWMIHRVDPPQDPDRRPLPEGLLPMTPVTGPLPSDEQWAFEIRWAGIRALLSNDAGHVAISDADGADVSDRFPEVRRIGRAIGAVECILDAVLVPLDPARRPMADRDRIRPRLEAAGTSRIRRLSEDRPVAATLVDLLWLEGHPTFDLPYDDRRRLLLDFDLQGPAWQTPGHHHGDGVPLLEAARAQGLPGLVAKRRDSRYVPGSTSREWVAVSSSS